MTRRKFFAVLGGMFGAAIFKPVAAKPSEKPPKSLGWRSTSSAIKITTKLSKDMPVARDLERYFNYQLAKNRAALQEDMMAIIISDSFKGGPKGAG